MSTIQWETEFTNYQMTTKGTARAHYYYFIHKQISANGAEWVAGYYGFNRLIVMVSAGTFRTAEEARAYVEEYDASREIITAQLA